MGSNIQNVQAYQFHNSIIPQFTEDQPRNSKTLLFQSEKRSNTKKGTLYKARGSFKAMKPLQRTYQRPQWACRTHNFIELRKIL